MCFCLPMLRILGKRPEIHQGSPEDLEHSLHLGRHFNGRVGHFNCLRSTLSASGGLKGRSPRGLAMFDVQLYKFKKKWFGQVPAKMGAFLHHMDRRFNMQWL